MGVGTLDPSYKEIFNQATQFWGVTTPNGIVRAVNDTILEFTGNSREGVIGKKLWECPGIRFSETAQRQVRADVRKAANTECVRHELDIQGAERIATIDFSIRPLTDESGDVTQLIAEGHDLSALKQQSKPASPSRHKQPSPGLLATYSRDADESMSEAIVQAFLALDIDIYEMDTTLQDWIDIDLLDGLDSHSGSPLTITTRIWGYNVELTTDEVRIYRDPHS